MEYKKTKGKGSHSTSPSFSAEGEKEKQKVSKRDSTLEILNRKHKEKYMKMDGYRMTLDNRMMIRNTEDAISIKF